MKSRVRLARTLLQSKALVFQNSLCNTHRDRIKAYFVLGHPGIALSAWLQGKQFSASNIQFRLPWVSEFHRQFVGVLKLIWGETGLWVASCTSGLMWVALVAFLYSQNKTHKLTVNTWSGTSLGYRMLGEPPSHFTPPRTSTGCLLLECFSLYLHNYLFFVCLSYKKQKFKQSFCNWIVKIGLYLDIFK